MPLEVRRWEKTVNGSDVARFLYDGQHVVEEYDGSDNLLRKFVYGQRIDEIRVMIAPDVADVDDDQNTTEMLEFYYHHDMLGSVTHITGPGRSVVEQYEYLPYGGTTIKDGSGTDLSGQSAIGNPYMFTARRFEEETGLYHYRRRAYDPVHGRFLQRDPAGYMVGTALHEYVRTRPTCQTDPLGLWPNWIGAGKGAVAGAGMGFAAGGPGGALVGGLIGGLIGSMLEEEPAAQAQDTDEDPEPTDEPEDPNEAERELLKAEIERISADIQTTRNSMRLWYAIWDAADKNRRRFSNLPDYRAREEEAFNQVVRLYLELQDLTAELEAKTKELEQIK